MTMSTQWGAQDASYLCDNDFDSVAGTDNESSPWYNIQLLESGTIQTVLIFFELGNENKIATSSIRIGDYSSPSLNAECIGGLSTHGLYKCTSPKTGTNIGVTRTG